MVSIDSGVTTDWLLDIRNTDIGERGVNSEQEWMKSAALGVGGGQCNIWDTGQVCHKWTKLDTWHKG